MVNIGRPYNLIRRLLCHRRAPSLSFNTKCANSGWDMFIGKAPCFTNHKSLLFLTQSLPERPSNSRAGSVGKCLAPPMETYERSPIKFGQNY
jgi:hypothetical protein